ncbi:MAG: cobalamin biosynthesis protein CbiD [Clostridiaceae bacterium]|nr:cobalamin biosynthesis protein CbiD [Clostridiaceae bacterium]
MEKYIIKNGKKLRYGYTTGSCAAAASKAAASVLLHKCKIQEIAIQTPKGWELHLEPLDMKFGKKGLRGVSKISQDIDWVSCGIKKDAGDDPDATNGIVIYSRVQWRQDNKINIDGGQGVGRVTKKGLPAPIGSAAINPIPLQMIEKEVREVIGYEKGVDVEICAPEGEKIAKKTFNPRLGIVGGISILGTSGIVEPMSEEAWKDSLALEISIAVEEGLDKLVFVPGNYGRDLARDAYNIKDNHMIKTSNFIGFMLDKALEYNIKKILLIGHIGKLVKVAAGIFHTHSKIADGRRETLAAYLGAMGGSPEEIKAVLESNTTEEVVEYIYKINKQQIFKVLAEKITEKAKERTYGEIEVGTVLFSMDHGVLSICNSGEALLGEFKNE